MPRRLLTVPLLLVPLLVVNHLIAGEEKLVPAQFNERNDVGGATWDIQSNGQISNGSNDCFDDGLVLMVNNRNFSAQTRNQTPDGSELVLIGQVNQLTVTRRILVDAKRRTVRYLEVVSNPTAEKQSVTLTLRSMLGNSAQQSVWSDGKPAVSGPLPKKCVAISGLHQPGESRPSVVWIIGDSQAKVSPTVEIRDNRQFAMRYALEIPAKQTVVVLHYVMQRPGLVSTQIPEAIKPLWHRTLIKPDIPNSLKRLVCNFRKSMSESEDEPEQGPRLPVISALLERAGVEDTGTKTLIGLGRSEAERMTGALLGGPLTATSEFGPVTVQVDELAGTEGSGFRTLLHLRNGETISTQSITGALRLETEAGVQLPVDPTQIAWLVANRTPNEGTASPDQLGVLMLTDGSRIAVKATSSALPMISTYGQGAVSFDQLERVERISDPPGWLVTMRDGSRLRVLPAAKELSITTCRYGVQQVVTARIAGYQRSGKPMNYDEDREDGAVLDNDERFYGGLAGTSLTINTNGAATEIPLNRIAVIERPEDGTGIALTFSDGGRLVGTTTDGTIALLAGGQTWRVPVRRLVVWQAPKPPEPPEEEEKDEKEGKDATKEPADSTPPKAERKLRRSDIATSSTSIPLGTQATESGLKEVELQVYVDEHGVTKVEVIKP